MDISERFDQELHKSRLALKKELTTVETVIKEMAEEFLAEFTKKVIDRELKTQIFWIDNNVEINAAVQKINDVYCIGIFSGVSTSLIDHIRTFYLNADIPYSELVIPGMVTINIFDGNSEADSFANAIYMFAIMYLFMHECGHILCGHCEDSAITCFENQNTKGSYEKQAKEYMADFYAIANAYNSLTLSAWKGNGDIKALGTSLPVFYSALNSLLWIFNSSKKPLMECNTEELTHAHPVVRMEYLIQLTELEYKHTIDMLTRRKEITLFKEDAIEQVLEAERHDFVLIARKTGLIDLFSEDDVDKIDEELAKISKCLYDVKSFYRNKAYISYQ